MRSGDPLTLKLHKKENWINLITFNNFSLDFQRISYLNKIVNFYYTKRHNIVSQLKSIELKKKIYITANLTFFSIFKKKTYSFFFKGFSFLKMTKRHFFFSTYFLKNFKLRNFDFFWPNKNFYKNVITCSFFSYKYVKNFSFYFLKNFSKKHITKISFTPLALPAFRRTYKTAYTELLNRMRVHGKRYLYVMHIFHTFFLYKNFIEAFLQKKLYKRVIIRPKFFFIKYFAHQYRQFIFDFSNKKKINKLIYIKQRQRTHNLHVLEDNKKYFGTNFSILMKSLGTALLYNQPELFLKGLAATLNNGIHHRTFYDLLEMLSTRLAFKKSRSLKLTFTGRFLTKHSMRAKIKSIECGKKICVQNFSKQLYYGTAVAKTHAGIVNIRLWWI